jgi:hypothetical protein
MMVAYHLGASSVQAKWDKAKAEATQAVLEKERNQQLITKDISHGFQTDIAAIDALFNGLPATGNGDLSKVSDPACGFNATACCNGFSELKRKAAQKQTSQLIWLQKWVTEQAK